MSAQLPENERERLQALADYQVLDTPPEREFDDLVAIAAHVCGTPISLVSLVDESRQWFKARQGLAVTETPREFAFCAHAILDSQPLVVGDARADPRFAENPLVVGEPRIRFYAGAPLASAAGYRLGTLCVIDTVARGLTAAQLQALEALARQASAMLQYRKTMQQLADALSRVRTLSGLLPICAGCKNIRDDQGFWQRVEAYISDHTDAHMTHGICPDCRDRLYPELRDA